MFSSHYSCDKSQLFTLKSATGNTFTFNAQNIIMIKCLEKDNKCTMRVKNNINDFFEFEVRKDVIDKMHEKLDIPRFE